VFFMVLYYNTAGLVADLALAFNMLFILGVMAAFQATLTLPGIAGVVLTIGMAVDANVLINERIREELAGGKTLRSAIDAGYEKAFSAILDSNVTTFLTGVILYQFGTGPIQGFALTLMIGIVATMFSSVVITRVVFNAATDNGLTPNFG
jgi:SecD/SecF fusion protein